MSEEIHKQSQGFRRDKCFILTSHLQLGGLPISGCSAVAGVGRGLDWGLTHKPQPAVLYTLTWK